MTCKQERSKNLRAMHQAGGVYPSVLFALSQTRPGLGTPAATELDSILRKSTTPCILSILSLPYDLEKRTQHTQLRGGTSVICPLVFSTAQSVFLRSTCRRSSSSSSSSSSNRGWDGNKVMRGSRGHVEIEGYEKTWTRRSDKPHTWCNVWPCLPRGSAGVVPLAFWTKLPSSSIYNLHKTQLLHIMPSSGTKREYDDVARQASLWTMLGDLP